MNSFFNSFKDIGFGFTAPFHAARLIMQKKSLILLSLIPVILTGALYYYALAGVQEWMQSFVTGTFSSWGISPTGFFSSLVVWGIRFILFIGAALSFAYCAVALSTPFNDFLAEKAESYALPPLGKIKMTFFGQIKLIWIDLVKTLCAALISLIALLVSWVPILNIFSILLTFLMLTFQFLTYPQTRRGIGFQKSFIFLWKHFFPCLGFGMIMSGLFAVPFVSFLFLPLGVVGGTLLFARLNNNAAKAKPSLPSSEAK